MNTKVVDLAEWKLYRYYLKRQREIVALSPPMPPFLYDEASKWPVEPPVPYADR